jgi:hypothetical protein
VHPLIDFCLEPADCTGAETDRLWKTLFSDGGIDGAARQADFDLDLGKSEDGIGHCGLLLAVEAVRKYAIWRQEK